MDVDRQTSGNDPLAVLEVIDRLDVGPTTVDPEGLRVPYRLYRGARQEVRELTVAYDEPVFDPGEAADRNLAAMIGAQVALNYGLFCRRIRFIGPFDEHDQRFLRVMLAKMAREIYVKKLLEPNPSLREPWRGLPALLRSDYVRADVRFKDGEGVEARAAGNDSDDVAILPERWKTDRARCAVLVESGTNDLLSHGLLSELGQESHPIFIDLQGEEVPQWRAYRAFHKEFPRTCRVRSNSNVVRSWISDHLPVEQRANREPRSVDGLPFELWDQATSIFAALPLLRQRQIGRLVTHELYDSTQRVWHLGIPHYDGRYDRSRHFDRALSRYFRTKGWGVSQLSLLRPLSELLAEKILCERYPRLSQLQLACRTPVPARRDVLPCATCEPCRRTVAVMLALDAAPGTRGFDRARQEEMLMEAVQSGIQLERASVEMVAHLLHDRGLIGKPRLGYVNARPRPEILHLRFDAESSLLEEIPVQLRRPLLEIFLEHSDGMLRRAGSEWVEIYDDEDPDPSLYFEHQQTA